MLLRNNNLGRPAPWVFSTVLLKTSGVLPRKGDADIGQRPCWVCSVLGFYASDYLLPITARPGFGGTGALVFCWLNSKVTASSQQMVRAFNPHKPCFLQTATW